MLVPREYHLKISLLTRGRRKHPWSRWFLRAPPDEPHEDSGPATRGTPRQPSGGSLPAPHAASTGDELSRDDPQADVELAVRTLGATEVWVSGHRIHRWSSKRAQMVFRYLLWERGPVRREVLMDLLWPHATAQSARNNLNVAIHAVRRTLEKGGPGPWVVYRAGTYRIAPERTIWCDVDEFEARRRSAANALLQGHHDVAADQLSRAAALYRGPLFADASTGEWYLSDRRALTEHCAEVLEHLARLQYEAGRYIESTELCRRLLRIEPCHESAHRLLMRSYAARGLRHLVARQYHECVDALKGRLGVQPDPNTTLVYNRLVDCY